MKAVIVVAVVSVLVITACASTRAQFEADVVTALKQQASFDLSCPADDIDVQQLGGAGSWGAQGCGEKASYLVSCDGLDVDTMCVIEKQG